MLFISIIFAFKLAISASLEAHVLHVSSGFVFEVVVVVSTWSSVFEEFTANFFAIKSDKASTTEELSSLITNSFLELGPCHFMMTLSLVNCLVSPPGDVHLPLRNNASSTKRLNWA